MHHITQANRPIFSDIFRRFYLRDQSDIGVIYFFRVCLVGGKIGRTEKKKERKLLGEVFGWKGEGEGILVGPRSFLSWPTKTLSP